MVEGGYAAEELLPSAKELAGRYGADHKTMRKALGALVDDRILEPRPRGFRIVRRRPRARNTILFLTAYRLADLSLRSMETFWLGELIRCLEIECGKRNLRFVPVCFTGNEAEVRRVTGTETVLGCVADTPSSPDMLSTLLADLRAPIAVLDNVVSFRLCDTPDFSADRRATSFVIDQHAIGRQVGRYLHGLGHRSVAYIAPFTGFAFGRERFLGTYSVYRESGAQAGVKLFDVNPPDEGAAAPGAVLPLRPSRVAEELLSLRLTDIRAVLDITTPSAYQRRLREDLFPAFEDVLRQYSATAWACANDLVALQALRFFREKGIRVPQDISLIGFDNSEAALYSRLTSYSFDIPGMALRMLMRVLSPLGRTVSPPSERIVATTGTIVERETTGRPGAV